MKFFRVGAAAKVSLIILVSRITGFVRDMCMAAFIGAGPVNDAFLAAFKLTNLFRSVFGEGAISAAVVPTISQSITTHGEKYARVIKCHVLTILSLSLALLTFFVFFNMRSIILITNPGFSSNPTIFDLAEDLAYITFPYLTFISVAAFYGSILQTKKVFAPYAATSIILNLVLISAALICFLDGCRSQVHSQSVGVLISGILELLWMIYFARKYNVYLHFRKPIMSKYVRQIMRRILPGIVGAGMLQISVWCDMIILSFFSGGISYFYFADRIVQLPLALFSTAIATTLLSSLSLSKSDAFDRAIRSCLFFIIPSAVGLFLISEEVVMALFRRGEFSQEAASNTAIILRILSFALPFQAISKIYTTSFHARGDTKTPMYVGCISLFINVSVSFMLMDDFNFLCVAIGSVAAAVVQLILLVFKSTDKVRNKKDILKYFAGATLMGFVIIILKDFIKDYRIIIQTILLVTVGAGTYIGFLATVKVKVLRDFFIKT
jgi:putative peptidoglycan lipid II flippase